MADHTRSIPLDDLSDLIECTRVQLLSVEFPDRTFGPDLRALRRTVDRRLRGPRALTAVVDDLRFDVRAGRGRLRITVPELGVGHDGTFWDVVDVYALAYEVERVDPVTVNVPAGIPLDHALHTLADAYDHWAAEEEPDLDVDDYTAEHRQWLDHRTGRRRTEAFPPGSPPYVDTDHASDLDTDEDDGTAAWWSQLRPAQWTEGLPHRPFDRPTAAPGTEVASDGPGVDDTGPDGDGAGEAAASDGDEYERYLAAYLAAQRTDRYRDFLVGLHALDDATLATRLPVEGPDVDEWRRSIRERSRAAPSVGPAEFTSDVVAHHTTRMAARDEAVVALQVWLGDLDEDGRSRLTARLAQHLEEEQLPVGDPGALLARAVDTVLAGPPWPGAWDPGTSVARWVGWLLLLAVDLLGGDVEGLAPDRRGIVPPRHGIELPVAGPPHVLVGRKDGVLRTHPVRKGFLVRTGPAGTGKTSTARATHLAWEGPSVTFTIRAEELTPQYVSLLLEKGPVHLLNATDQRVVLHPDVQQVRWSPLQLVHDWDSAVFAAHVLLSAVSKSDLTDGAFWDHLARCALGPLLFAAAQHPDRYSMRHIAMWTTAFDQHEAEVMGLLARAGCEAAAVGWAGVLRQDPRTKSSIFATAQTAISSYWFDHVNAICERPTFDAAEFLASNGTVLVLADSLKADLTSALYTTFLDHLITERKLAASDPQHPGHHRFLFVDVDEAANVVRLPSLASLCTTAGGFGIAGSIVLHDHSQAVHRWGVLAPLFINAAGMRIVYPGTAPSEICRCAGELAPTDPIDPEEILVSGSLAEPPERMGQVRDWDDPTFVAAARRAMVLQDPRNHLWGRPRPAAPRTVVEPPPFEEPF